MDTRTLLVCLFNSVPSSGMAPTNLEPGCRDSLPFSYKCISEVDAGNKVWLTAGVPVHPKGVGWGWGQGSLHASPTPNTEKHIFRCKLERTRVHLPLFVQWLAKVFTPLELFHILSHFDHKCKCILLGFYVIDQHKVVHNCEVERKWYMFFFLVFFFTNKK